MDIKEKLAEKRKKALQSRKQVEREIEGYGIILVRIPTLDQALSADSADSRQQTFTLLRDCVIDPDTGLRLFEDAEDKELADLGSNWAKTVGEAVSEMVETVKGN